MSVPVEYRKDAQIKAAIARVMRELSPGVRYMRYRIGKNWSDEWAVFFNVVLSDEAADMSRLRDITSRVISRVTDELDLPSFGMFPHFNFRSESEQAKLNSPEWAAPKPEDPVEFALNWNGMIVPVEFRKDAQIKAAIATVMRELSPWVHHIRYRIAKDWSDEWAVFFNVVISDEGADQNHLSDITSRVMSRITDELDLPNLGMFPHFNFRSESEQAKLNSPEWAAVA